MEVEGGLFESGMTPSTRLPLELTTELQLEALGRIDHERPGFHNSANVFPVGYRAVRDWLQEE